MLKTLDDYVNTKGNWSQRKKIDYKQVWTLSGSLWNNIRLRCSGNTKYLEHFPTYEGCTNNFKDFNTFVSWHRQQVGYGLGYCIDADILKNGAKVYSESTCLLVPNALNIFIQGHAGKRPSNSLPQGVYLTNNKQALRAQIYTDKGGFKFLGTFALDDVEKAHSVYKEAKNAAAQDWYNRLTNGEYLVDERVVEYMRNWRQE